MNATPQKAARTPSSAYSGYSKLDATPNAGRCRNAWLPNAARPTAAAATELSTTTPNDRVSKSRRITSNAKNTPASGALNVAEIPAPAPHATNNRSRCSPTRAT